MRLFVIPSFGRIKNGSTWEALGTDYWINVEYTINGIVFIPEHLHTHI